MKRVGKAFLENEIASGFPILSLIKHPEIQMRINWVNRLIGSQKSMFVEELFEQRENSVQVKEFESLLMRPINGRYRFSTRKELLRRLKKDGGDWRFSGNGESVVANYKIGNVDLMVMVSATERFSNIRCEHCLYRKPEGLVGAFRITHYSRFHYQDVWHSENLQAEQEYESVMKVLNCGYEMLSEALLSCEDPFSYK